MARHEEWVIDPKDLPVWQAPDDSRRVNLLVCEEICDAKDL